MTYRFSLFLSAEGQMGHPRPCKRCQATVSPVHPSPAPPNLLQAPCTLQAPFVCQKSVTPIILQRLVEGVFRNAADAFSRHAESPEDAARILLQSGFIFMTATES
jgi:hypothetical protein